MSISPTLRASARAVYRELWRASAITFSGDETILTAFRLKMRNEIIPTSISESSALEEKVSLARDIATVLRRNIVQGRRVDSPSSSEGETRWKLRITEHTELGSNETVKDPSPMVSSRSARKRQVVTPSPEKIQSTTTHTSNIPRYYSQLKKAHQLRKIPELREEDLEETFVRGSGPGGQSINKTENNVQLVHKPTGVRVTCQETRSLALNRRLARRRIQEKLDQIQNPGLSKQDLLQAKQNERERRRRKRAKKKTPTKEKRDNELIEEQV